MSQYSGDSDGKRIARWNAYEFARARWEWILRPTGGYAITLAGPDAAEAHLITERLGWKEEDTIFVDADEAGLKCAKRKLPQCKTWNGPIQEMLASMSGRIAFVHLDFMGHMTDAVRETVKGLRGRLVPGAIIMYTYMRGRENFGSRAWSGLVTSTKHVLGLTAARLRSMEAMGMLPEGDETSVDGDDIRCAGYIEEIARGLGCTHDNREYEAWSAGRSTKPQGRLSSFLMSDYVSTSPMGLVGLHYIPKEKIIKCMKKLQRMAVVAPGMTVQSERIPKNKAKEWLIGLIVSLRRDGVTSEEIGKYLNLPTKTVIARLAHYERGTYGDLENVVSQ